MTQVNRYAVKAIAEKSRRAIEQLQLLQRDVERFDALRPRPWSFVHQISQEGRFYQYRLRVDVPPEWGVRFGESVHNMRSALDHVIYQLVTDYTKRLPQFHTEFPVCRTRRAFQQRTDPNSGGKRAAKFHSVGDGVHAFVEGLQPYRGRPFDPVHHSLAELHSLWNSDKHRTVVPWVATVYGVPGMPLVEVYQASGRAIRLAEARLALHPLRDGQVAFSFRIDPPHSSFQARTNIALRIAMRPLGRRRPLRSILEVFTLGDTVVKKLLGAIGDQDRPIPLT